MGSCPNVHKPKISEFVLLKERLANLEMFLAVLLITTTPALNIVIVNKPELFMSNKKA